MTSFVTPFAGPALVVGEKGGLCRARKAERWLIPLEDEPALLPLCTHQLVNFEGAAKGSEIDQFLPVVRS